MDHPFISAHERDYIVRSLAAQQVPGDPGAASGGYVGASEGQRAEEPSCWPALLQDSAAEWAVPLRAMLGSLPLWGIVVAHLTVYWYLYILMAYTPTYISSVLRVSLSDVSTALLCPAGPAAAGGVALGNQTLFTGQKLPSRTRTRVSRMTAFSETLLFQQDTETAARAQTAERPQNARLL